MKPSRSPIGMLIRAAGIFVIGVAILSPSPGLAQVTMNIFAVNASETESRELEVQYHLPPEVDPDVIVDLGPLKLDYDVDKGAYYVHTTARFGPKESKTFKIKVKDIWRITEAEVDVLKKQLAGNLDLLKDHDNYAYAEEAKAKLIEQLDEIVRQQDAYSENIERRIEEYRAQQMALEKIRSAAFDLDFLEHESKALDELSKQGGTVKFVVEVKNPDAKAKKDVQHKHFLPAEVRETDIVDAKDFAVRFDMGRNCAYLSKEEEFLPGEIKRYEIIIKDIWHFPLAKVEAMEKRVEIAMGELQNSIYAKSAGYLSEVIAELVKSIRESQGLQLPAQEHIGLFRLNEQRYEDIKKNVERLEKMMSIVRAKKLKELESGKVQNILQKLKALRGLSALSEAIFKRGISVTATWKIIFGILIFVAVFTAAHFIIWARRSGRRGEERGTKTDEIKEVPKPGTAKAEG